MTAPVAVVHALAWRGRRPVSVALCTAWPDPVVLSEEPRAVTCRTCKALALLRDVWRMTADVRPLHPTIEAIGELLEQVEQDLATPLPTVQQ